LCLVINLLTGGLSPKIITIFIKRDADYRMFKKYLLILDIDFIWLDFFLSSTAILYDIVISFRKFFADKWAPVIVPNLHSCTIYWWSSEL